MTCTQAVNTICKHTDDTLTRYVDITDQLAVLGAVTITSGTVDAGDSGVTVGSVTVTASEVTDVDQYGNSVTIAAGKAIQFQLSGGAAQAESDDPYELTAAITLSNGEIVAKTLLLRVE